jgi:protein-S-isoprenylcysteine O-methyltransferase Ste14
LTVVSFIWIISEVVLARIRRSSSKEAKSLDRLSLRYIWIAIFVSVIAGVVVAMTGFGFISYAPSLMRLSGIVIIVIGLIVRWIAILTLHRYFTTNVSIQAGHELVTIGIYSFLRHPAYAGSLMSFFGLGLSLSNWISLPVVFVPVLFAFLYRIKVEEEVLRNYFGEKYDLYSKKASRLLPGIY